MLSRTIVLLGLILGVALFSADAKAERRVALVVGNASYTNAAMLRNPRNDAEDMARTLKGLGFDVITGLDLDQPRFASVIDQFARTLDGADVALFFYAGHGVQINERNYLVSTNARLDNEFMVSAETIELNTVVRLMESKVPVNLVFVDACRNNPLTENLRKNLAAMKRTADLGRGLARIEPTTRDTLIAFAAAPGQEAADGNDRNSPFTGALLKYIPKPDLEVSVMLKSVANDVRQVTRNAQRPQQLSDMTRTFYFAKSDAVAKAEPVAPAPAPAPASPPRTAAPNGDDRTLEVAFWNAAQAANECEAMRAYLTRFPNGIFTELGRLAERRLCAPTPRVTILDATPGTSAPPAAPSPPRQNTAAAAPPVVAPPAPTRPAPLAPSQQPRASLPPPAAAQVAPPAAPPQQQALVVRPQRPAEPGAPAAARDCERCPEMVNIPAGAFVMGSNEDASERPVREVAVSAFAMGRYPVTIGEWNQCVAAKACTFQPQGGDDLPVFNISWDDAQQYVAWLSRTTQNKYRLPTEAEWEYAARGRSTTRFWWGNQLVAGKAACKGCGSPSGNTPTKVGLFEPNGFGLYDMTGSIGQWISDCWHRDYTGAPRTSVSWNAPNCRRNVVRGGSWMNDASYLRTSSRDSYDSGVRYIAHGLRVVREQGK